MDKIAVYETILLIHPLWEEDLTKIAKDSKADDKEKKKISALTAITHMLAGEAGTTVAGITGNKASSRVFHSVSDQPSDAAEYNTLKRKSKARVIEGGIVGPHYNPATDTIHMGKSRNADVLAHEMGHSRGAGKILQKLYLPGMLMGGAGNLAGLGLVGAGLLSKPEDQEKRFEQARNAALLGQAATWAPILAEEARATGRAVAAAKSGTRLRRMKVLTPAFLTYGTAAVPGLGLPAAYEVLRRKAANNSTKK